MSVSLKWNAETFKNLYRDIERVTQETPSASILRDLSHKLQTYKPLFLVLLDFLPKTGKREAFKKEPSNAVAPTLKLEDNEYLIEPDFAQAIFLLSDILNLDESLAAIILIRTQNQAARLGKNAVETAITFFESECNFMLGCLERIVATVREENLSPDIKDLFARYVEDLLQTYSSAAPTTSSSSFPQHILKTINKLKEQITQFHKDLITPMQQNGIYTPIQGISTEDAEDVIMWFNNQRRTLGRVLYHIARNFRLEATEIMEVAKTLQSADFQESLTPHLVITLLAYIDISGDHNSALTSEPKKYSTLQNDKTFISNFSKFLNNDANDGQSHWKIPEIRKIIQLQWILFIWEVLPRNPSLRQQLNLQEDQLLNLAKESIEGNAFQFIIQHFLTFQRTDDDIDPEDSLLPIKNLFSINDIRKKNASSFSIEKEFQETLLNQFQSLVTSFIAKMTPSLHGLKRREEDSIQAAKLSQPSSIETMGLRQDLATFLHLIATIYRGRPDEGLKFWENYRAFLKWGASVSETGMIRAYLEMLCSLATGPKCSEQADRFLIAEDQNTEWCSWKMLEKAVVLYGSPPLVRLGAGTSGSQSQSDNKIRPDESSILSAFLRVLCQIVQYSEIARNRFQKEGIINKLFAILNRELRPRLKASVLNAISAFCRSVPGRTHSATWEVWKLLENSQIIPTIPKQIPNSAITSRPNNVALSGGGMKKELVEAEVANQTYPQTLAFLNLISNLIHIDNERAAQLFAFPAISLTIPFDLGSTYRTPGITPYISFIIDNILTKASLRSYHNPLEQWEIISKSLEITEKCLLSFNLTGPLFHDSSSLSMTRQEASSINQSSESSINQEILRYLKHHPGFDVMKRLLSKTALIETMFNILEGSSTKLVQNIIKTPHFSGSIVRILRIIDMAIQKERRFSRILIPLLRENPPGNFESVFLNESKIVIQIALLLQAEDHAICFYAIKILLRLSRFKAFNDIDRTDGRGINRLVKTLASSDESDRIISGFIERLELNGVESANNDVIDHEDENIIQNLKNLETPELQVNDVEINSESVRLAIADLILENLRPGTRPPTIAHFLLGYDFEGASRKATIKYIDAFNTRTSCLHMILSLLGHSNRESEEYEDDTGSPDLFLNNPGLASRFYEIIYRLCADGKTSEPTMTHLRTIKFFIGQLKSMPLSIPQSPPHNQEDNSILIQFDQVKLKVDYNTIKSTLDQKTWLLKILALELQKCQIHSEVSSLLSLLLGRDSVQELEKDITMEEELNTSFNNGRTDSQQRGKLLDLLDMLDHQWKDSCLADTSQRRYFDRLDIEAFLTQDRRGIRVYNIRDLYSALQNLENNMRKRGAISNEQELHQEFRSILEYCYSQNRKTCYEAFKLESFKGWREVIDVIIYNHYEVMNFDRREPILVEIVSTLLPKIRPQQYLNTSLILSYVIVSALSKLCQDRRFQSTLQSIKLSSRHMTNLPPEKLHNMFRSVLYGIIGGFANTEMRMNFYVGLYLYFQYCNPETEISVSIPSRGGSLPSTSHSAVNFSDKNLIPLMGGGALRAWGSPSLKRGTGTKSIVDAGNFATLRELGDRLLNVLRSDASAGHVAAQLASISTLIALCALYQREKDNSIVDYLIKTHFLSETLRDLKRSDDLLKYFFGRSAADQSVLHASYLFESRMALLIRIAQSRESAIKLLDSGMIETLENMKFLDDRPAFNKPTGDLFGKLGYIRYHQLLLWVLRLVIAIFTSIGHDNSSCLAKVSKFIRSHQGVLADILSDNVPLGTLTSDDQDACLIYLEALCEVISLFYFLGNRITILDKERQDTRQPAFHSLLKETIAKYFYISDWRPDMMDIGDEFKIQRAQNLLKYINRNLLTWAHRVTDSKGLEFKPIFTGSLEVANRRDDSQTEKEPELSAIIICLRLLVEGLFKRLQEYNELSQKLGNYNNMPQSDVDEILETISENYVHLLNHSQCQTLAIQELFKRRSKALRKINSYLNDVEIALLLLWRHLEHYLSPTSASKITPFSNFPSQTLIGSPSGSSGGGPIERLRSDAQLHLKGTLDKLASLDKHLTKEHILDTFSKADMSCLDLEQRESQKETGDSLSPHIYYGSQEVPASKPGVEWTRLVCLSDTHNKIDANTKGFIVPVGDVLIHAGDLTKNGTVGQIHATFDWLKGLPHRYKIIIAGNHDLTLDPPFYEKNWHRFHRNKENSAESLKIVRNTKNGIVYLEDESYTIPECGYKVFGSPWSPEFCEWAFNAKRGEECQKVWAKIPLDTQILITHGPPYKILDKTFQDLEVGCPDLLERRENGLCVLQYPKVM
ncbi:hypothetical protein G9A89_023374 [Geosiphon pyriformis]|nr:hypothetical protein G9A89_023374 [Geosiphon pyriformis]